MKKSDFIYSSVPGDGACFFPLYRLHSYNGVSQ